MLLQHLQTARNGQSQLDGLVLVLTKDARSYYSFDTSVFPPSAQARTLEVPGRPGGHVKEGERALFHPPLPHGHPNYPVDSFTWHL
jgi:hypothetical protein